MPVRGGRHNEPALAFADGRQEVHNATAGGNALGFHLDALLRVERRQVVKENLVTRLFG